MQGRAKQNRGESEETALMATLASHILQPSQEARPATTQGTAHRLEEDRGIWDTCVVTSTQDTRA